MEMSADNVRKLEGIWEEKNWLTKGRLTQTAYVNNWFNSAMRFQFKTEILYFPIHKSHKDIHKQHFVTQIYLNSLTNKDHSHNIRSSEVADGLNTQLVCVF